MNRLLEKIMIVEFLCYGSCDYTKRLVSPPIAGDGLWTLGNGLTDRPEPVPENYYFKDTNEDAKDKLLTEETQLCNATKRLYVSPMGYARATRLTDQLPVKRVAELIKQKHGGDAGIFAFEPDAQMIFQRGDNAVQDLVRFVLRVMEDDLKLRYITWIEIGYSHRWDVLLVGVSPFSGRLLCLRAYAAC